MANTHGSRPNLGETRFGSDRDGIQGQVTVQTAGNADAPSILALESCTSAGVVATWYLWVDSTGDLRIANAIPTDEDGDGTVVGSQS